MIVALDDNGDVGGEDEFGDDGDDGGDGDGEHCVVEVVVTVFGMCNV